MVLVPYAVFFLLSSAVMLKWCHGAVNINVWRFYVFFNIIVVALVL